MTTAWRVSRLIGGSIRFVSLPPPWVGRLNEHGGTLTTGNLHAAMELTTLPFNLGGRLPQAAGANPVGSRRATTTVRTISEAAPKLLDRCYAIVEENKRSLLEMVRATYADDVATMDRLRSRAAVQAAALLADACYTALSIAAEKR